MQTSKLLIINHVLYEIQMYQQSLLSLLFLKEDIENKLLYSQIIINALYESHMIHLRNMFCFFNNKKSDKNDIIYSDVILQEDKYYSTYEEYKKHKESINKSVPHLDLYRTDTTLIDKNKSGFFIYCYFSTTKFSKFEGFGNIIKRFLEELIEGTNIQQNIRNELDNKEMESLLNRIMTENNSLQITRKSFLIEIDSENKILVKVIDKPSVIYSESEQ